LGSGPNPTGDLPAAGAQNLYLSEEGQVSFIGTLTDRDVVGRMTPAKVTVDGLGLWSTIQGGLPLLSRQPALDPSRTNPDGSVLLFQSRANLTGYDPKGAPQVYRYDSNSGALECISCIPTGAPAGEGAAIQSYLTEAGGTAPLGPNDFLPGLTPDGRRAFFESTEALVSSDTDGIRDVYEWEAQGVGSCVEADGCVYLISSGHSAAENFLFAQSTDGDGVFFTSGDRLTDDDPSATPSIYDARVGGGFATSTVAGECLGEACQPAASAPGDPIPVLHGAGNPGQAPTTTRCQKPKRKVRSNGKTRCVKPKKKSAQHHRKTAKQGRAGR
jgi:hypothetical protein